MSSYPEDPRPPEATCPEGLEELVEWEQSRADYYEARVKELEEKINWWAYNLPILDCKGIINEMLTETGEGDDESK